MNSLYAQYIKEREDFEIIEDEFGFASYKFFGPECYIRDIYVVPEKRKTSVGTSYMEKITALAKEAGCTHLTGTVFPSANGSSESMAAILRGGFKIHSSTSEKIILTKEIL